MNKQSIRVGSRGFDLLKQLEVQKRKNISLESVAEDTDLGLSTVRKYLGPMEKDLYGAAIGPAIILAGYLNVPLYGENGLLYVLNE